jgi:teichuronic acid biosynthesis glycosyltransferase TuaC
MPLRIAFLCKRRYMGKDVIQDRYARLYEIPSQLARRGHSVLCICLDYHTQDHGRWEHDSAPGTLVWTSGSLGGFVLPSLGSHIWQTLQTLKRFKPDLVMGASDIPHTVLAQEFARRLGRPYAIDLYDNFEGFGQARIPGMKTLLRRAVRDAALVTTTSEPLAAYVQHRYRPTGEVVPMPSTVDKKLFRPRDQQASRRKLGLPENVRLVGTAGGLYQDKGVGELYDAWRRIAAEFPDVHLVLAGPYKPEFPPPSVPTVHYLGEVPHAQTAELFAALDVGIIYVRDTAFGRYCFPQKAYEMLACRLPVVAARIGAMEHLLTETPQCLYAAEDELELADRICQQLARPIIPNVAIDDWQTLVSGLAPRLEAIGHGGRRGPPPHTEER